MKNLSFRTANSSDIQNLMILINQAYRTNNLASWTSEEGIVAGARINEQQLLHLLLQQNVQLFVADLQDSAQQTLLGCIGLTFQQDTVEIGTFCVASSWQNQGVGRQLLEYAEMKAQEICVNLKCYEMFVLDVRSELIEYYERCGYVKTACIENYPMNANVGRPLIDLKLQQMKKLVMQ
ncbi:hypothetical protein B9T25_13655 [Acinetobacter sp. ANC 4470]|uniref:GNAT family N-acetyltransferase n=1 Tax=Acinetobacter sp. ANC 4470 TaxID=1977881 RepID=UPI000A3318C3|nr:GNAT family N-acetyltransferase [Acinetobacter sp. ANC 4470]OTG63536.1 hypothetical protein B9T25_13655 [Acinetobacter sp. ANC 4470]